jgi:hypothetical protein
MRAVLWILLAACSGKDEIPKLPDGAVASDANLGVDAAPPRETQMSTQSLQAGELIEGIMHGKPGDEVIIHLSAPGPDLDWNLHSHLGGGTQTIYEELHKTTVDYPFLPAAEADWYILLRNSGPTNMDVQVKLDLYGEMTWVGWQ